MEKRLPCGKTYKYVQQTTRYVQQASPSLLDLTRICLVVKLFCLVPRVIGHPSITTRNKSVQSGINATESVLKAHVDGTLLRDRAVGNRDLTETIGLNHKRIYQKAILCVKFAEAAPKFQVPCAYCLAEYVEFHVICGGRLAFRRWWQIQSPSAQPSSVST